MTAAPDLSASLYLSRITENLAPRTDILAAEDYVVGLADIEMDLPEDEFRRALAHIKHMFDLAWSRRRFAPVIDAEAVQSLGALRSEFAAKSIDKTLQYAWPAILKANRLAPAKLEGLFILGLGKLGGHDLNFSSDVDIICFYDHDKFPVPETVGKNYIANKLMQAVSRILHSKNIDDLIWRVDWRLRPEASATGLAITAETALNFYFFRSQPWHRLAMIKARPVAGDIEAGEGFLKELTPFIWRQNLDYRALDEIGYLKRRINLEHPTLRLERTQSAPITEQLFGFNVKLGRGGIREIEFIVNALQLIWAGRKYELRHVTTLQALDCLAGLGHLTQAEAQTLSQAYIIYRRIEDAIQLIDNEQTHILPDQDIRGPILSILNMDDDDLSAQIYGLRRGVNDIFERFFHLDDEDKTEAPEAGAEIDTEHISALGQEIIQSWQNGFDSYGLQPAQFAQFRNLGQQCLSYVAGSTDDVDQAVQTIHKFLSRLSRSHQYFSVLGQSDIIFTALIDPLLYSPHMTKLLEQSPHIIDIFLDPLSPVNLEGEALKSHRPDPAYILAGEHYETRLERLRRFVNENLFAYYHLFLTQGRAPEFFSRSTDLAAITLETAIEVAANNLGLESPPMAVLALGKMGTGHMSPQSDLDLVFVFDDDFDFGLASKLVRRIKTALTVQLQEGIAYELDMRLRPSGRSGPAAVSFESFQTYQNERAKTWEHIALCSARCVAGAANMRRRVDQTVQDVLSRPRDAKQCRHDAALMWERIKQQRLGDNPRGIIPDKLAEGGLMQAEYIQATKKLLGQSDKALNKAVEFWRILQIWERLLNLKGRAFNDLPPRYKEAILSSMGARSEAALSCRAQGFKTEVIKAADDMLGGLEVDLADKELPIKWT